MAVQVLAGMWKRNGYSVVNQVINYQFHYSKEVMFDKDIIMLQVGDSLGLSVLLLFSPSSPPAILPILLFTTPSSTLILCISPYPSLLCSLSVLSSPSFHLPVSSGLVQSEYKQLSADYVDKTVSSFHLHPYSLSSLFSPSLPSFTYDNCTLPLPVQAMAAILDPDIFMYALIYKFRLEKWLTW